MCSSAGVDKEMLMETCPDIANQAFYVERKNLV